MPDVQLPSEAALEAILSRNQNLGVPVDPASENSVVAYALLAGDSDFIQASGVKPQHFHQEFNRGLWEIAAKQLAAGTTPDVTSVGRAWRQRYGGRDDANFRDLVRDAYAYDIGMRSWADNAAMLVRSAYRARQIISLSSRLVANAQKDWPLGEAELVGRFLAEVSKMDTSFGREPIDFATALDNGLRAELEAFPREDPSKILSTGLNNLDFYIKGWRRGGMYCIGAGTSIGKSLFVQWTAMAQALRGHKVLIFSTEMGADQVFWRIACMLAEVDPEAAERRGVTEKERRRIDFAIKRAYDLPIRVIDTPKVVIEEIAAAAYAHRMRYGLDIVVMDHLHEAKRDDKFSGAEGLDHIADGLKAIARECNVAVLTVVQLNRSGNLGGDINSLIKGSSGIAQKADGTVFLNAMNSDGTFMTDDEARARAVSDYTLIGATIGKMRFRGRVGLARIMMSWQHGARWYDAADDD